MAFAGGDNHDGDKHKIRNLIHERPAIAAQGIGQDTETLQSSSCGSGDDTIASCNNVAFSLNLNDGNNALGQQ